MLKLAGLLTYFILFYLPSASASGFEENNISLRDAEQSQHKIYSCGNSFGLDNTYRTKFPFNPIAKRMEPNFVAKVNILFND